MLGERGQTLATAESLTGGLLGAAITAVPGASTVYRGGITAYATELKAVLLGVPEDLLARHGPIHPGVAAAMAAGARERLGATWAWPRRVSPGPTRPTGFPRVPSTSRPAPGRRPPGAWPWPATGTGSAGTLSIKP